MPEHLPLDELLTILQERVTFSLSDGAGDESPLRVTAIRRNSAAPPGALDVVLTDRPAR